MNILNIQKKGRFMIKQREDFNIEETAKLVALSPLELTFLFPFGLTTVKKSECFSLDPRD